MNKDVLDYTIEELESLPLDLLNKLALEADFKESEYNTRQLVEKVLMNSFN